MNTLYLARHGQSEANNRGVMESRLDSPLDPMGKEQVALLAERLRGVSFGYIYTSPSLRARLTAEKIIEQRNATIIQDEALYEMDIGSWEGLTPEEAERSDPVQYKLFRQQPERYFPVEGESFADVQNRAITLLTRLLNNHNEEDILIVSHSVVIKLLLCHFKGETIRNVWDAPRVQNASLSIVKVHNPNEYSVEVEADVGHLQHMTMT